MSNQTDTAIAIEQTPAAEKKFAVFRDHHRVSNSEYDTAKEGQHEYNYWHGILKRWGPDGTRLSIRELKWRRKEKETPDAETVPENLTQKPTDKPEQTQ